MPPPTVRLTLNKNQIAWILPGLAAVVDGQAGASIGCYPHRHPFDRANPVLSNVFVARHYDEQAATTFLNVRNRLKYASAPHKFRFTVMEIAALMFGLRTESRRRSTLMAGRPADDPEFIQWKSTHAELKKLARKLEMFRKRAKRRTLKQVVKAVYDQVNVRWRQHLEWLRYNCLYFHLPYRPGIMRRNWLSYRQSVKELASEALASNGFAPLTEHQVGRIAKLAVDGLRRGRYRVSLQRILRDKSVGMEFMLKFIFKRYPVTVVNVRLAPWWARQSASAQKFATARVIEAPSVSDTTAVAAPTNSEPPRRIRQSIAPYQIANGIAQWLKREVEPDYWEAVVEEVEFQMVYTTNTFESELGSSSLRDIFEQCRPNSDEPRAIFETKNDYVTWILTAMWSLTHDRLKIASIVDRGLIRAKTKVA